MPNTTRSQLRDRRHYLEIAVLTFGILCLELALIRWVSGQMRVFAYFANLILIGAFLGLGLGAGFGRRGKNLLRFAPMALLGLSIPIGLASELGLTDLRFPDPSVALWGGERMTSTNGNFAANVATNVATFLGVWLVIVAVFFLLGTRLGQLFREAGPERSLNAYAWDLAGSLAGTVAFALLTLIGTTPVWWLMASVIPMVLLLRSVASLAASILVVMLALHSQGDAQFSPYNRIDVAPWANGAATFELRVNRDFHQQMHDFRPATMETLDPSSFTDAAFVRAVYDLPFALLEGGGSTLIVGAGTGNDAAAAARNGYNPIVAVDIDPVIISIGVELHAEAPYRNKATAVVADARAYFSTAPKESFDLVNFGLLDSHAMASAMSTLRIDNFVYTEESIAQAWSLVKPDGAMAISFSVFSGEWIGERIRWTIAEATGQMPLTIFHGMHVGATFFVAKEGAELDWDALSRFEPMDLAAPRETVRVATDDWPFLYVRPGNFPWLYVGVMLFVVAIAVLGSQLIFRSATGSTSLNWSMFFLGAGFLLLETRGITAMSVLAGSTWIVNAAVFTGVLIMALAATLIVMRYRIEKTRLMFLTLVASCLFLAWFDLSLFMELDLVPRVALAGLILAIPVFFAGLLFPTLFAKSPDPAAALGSNLLGAVIGGCTEYASMALGLSAMAGIAAVFYLLAWSAHTRFRA